MGLRIDDCGLRTVITGENKKKGDLSIALGTSYV